MVNFKKTLNFPLNVFTKLYSTRQINRDPETSYYALQNHPQSQILLILTRRENLINRNLREKNKIIDIIYMDEIHMRSYMNHSQAILVSKLLRQIANA